MQIPKDMAIQSIQLDANTQGDTSAAAYAPCYADYSITIMHDMTRSDIALDRLI